ncbi:MAG TPA: CPBP family intramembrane glutamic endopeptidase [Caulobacteraceae bacterium]
MTSLIQYAERGRNDWWRYLCCTPLALVTATLLGVGIVVLLFLAHAIPPDLQEQMTHPTRPAVFFTATGVSFGCLLIGFIAAIRLLHDKRFGDLLGDWRWQAVAVGAAVWFAVQALAAFADFGLAPRSFSLTASGATLTLLLTAVPALAAQTFAEELVFRGYLTQGLLLATRRPLPAALISGLIFGAVHIPNGTPQAVNAAVFGIATAYIAITTGSIAFSFGLHFVNNLFGAVLVVSASDVFRGAPGLFSQNAPQLMWQDVAVQGFLIVLVAALVAWRWRPAPTVADVF